MRKTRLTSLLALRVGLRSSRPPTGYLTLRSSKGVIEIPPWAPWGRQRMALLVQWARQWARERMAGCVAIDASDRGSRRSAMPSTSGTRDRQSGGEARRAR